MANKDITIKRKTSSGTDTLYPTTTWGQITSDSIPDDFNPSPHTHGNINDDGEISDNQAIASGDRLVISDSSDSNKLTNSAISFGTSTSTFLRNDGTWGTVASSFNGGTITNNLTIDSASFASLTLDRESTTSSSIVQFTNNGGVVGGIGGFGNDGLQFRTTDGTQMVIDSSNNVGIGTTSPGEKLQVEGDVLISGSGGTMGTTSSIANAFLKVGTGLGLDPNQILFTSTSYINSVGTLALAGGGNGATSDLHITTDHKVGIGTTSPSYGLDVHANNGEIRAYGTTGKVWAEASDSGQASFELKNTEGHFRFITDNGEYYIYDQTDSKEVFRISTAGNTAISGNLTVTSAYPRIYLTDTDSDSDYSVLNGNGYFSVYDDTNSAFRLRIDSSGTTYFYNDIAIGNNTLDFNANSGDSVTAQLKGDRSSTDLDTRNFTTEGGFSYTTFNGDTSNKPGGSFNNANGVITMNTHSGAYNWQLAFANNQGGIFNRYRNGGSYTSWERMFDDGYHPNADKWTTARTITLGGDLSGSVSLDGSANVTLTAAVSDDSHNHIISNVDGLQTALDAKAPKASPALTGTPTAPTAANTTNSTQIATTAFVQNKLAGINTGLEFQGTISLSGGKDGDDLASAGFGSFGDYLIVSTAGDLVSGGTLLQIAVQSPGDEGDSSLPVTLEVGDWIVYQSLDETTSPSTVTVAIINNTDTRFAAASHTHSQYLEKAGGTLTGTLTSRAIAMQNYNLTGVNMLQFNDPGPNEGIDWSGGNFKIYESPDNLTTNSAGNLQFVAGGQRRMTVGTDGYVYVGSTLHAPTSVTSAKVHLTASNPILQLTDSDTSGSAYIDYQGGTSLKVHAGGDALTFVAGNAERARISSGGNLGIGTTNPSARLEVIGDFKIKQGSGYSNYGLIDQTEAKMEIRTYSVNTSSYPADIVFKPNLSERMRITDDGNVGIGTDSPTGKLEIVGDDGLYIKATTNNASDGAQIRFSDSSSSSYSQYGFIKYKHANQTVSTEPVNSDDGFIIGGSETNTVVSIEGSLNVEGQTNFENTVEIDSGNLLVQNGNITVSGTVDGVDIAALNTTVAGKLNATAAAAAISYVTSCPTSDNSTGMKVYVGSTDCSTKYNGWLYLIT